MKRTENDRQRPNYYGLAAIRRSLGHYVLGKGVTAITSLLVFIIIVRYLAVGEFAAYATLNALVLMLGLISSPGLKAVLLRFLPELRAKHNNLAMYRLLAIGIALRMVLYAAAGFLLLAFADVLSELLKIDAWRSLLPLYLVVGFFRINATFASAVLESLLWQREAQFSLAVAYLVKLVALLAVVLTGNLTLELLVWIECGVELLALMLLIMSAFVRRSGDRQNSIGDGSILVQDWRRYANFGLWAYAQNLTSILYGSAPNRLVISYFLPVGSIAVFGAVDRLITYIRRYEPLLVFLGMVRPIFNSRFTNPGDFPRLVSMANLLFRLNFVVLLVPFILFAVAGEPVFGWLTAGKYTEAASIFLAFYVVLILGSANPMIDVLVKVVEQNRIYTVSNLILSASIGLAVPLLPVLGLWGLALANATGIVLAISVILRYLRKVGYPIAIDGGPIVRIVVAAAAAVGVGHLALQTGIITIAAVMLSYLCFGCILYVWPAFREDEKQLILKVKRGRYSASSNTKAATDLGSTMKSSHSDAEGPSCA